MFEEVKEALKDAKNTRSSGPDGISNFILKLSSSSLATPMTTIFNLSLSSGEYPAIWKEARILPLHKKQSKLDINNYRNINLVSKTGLIFEKLIHKQISDHFTKYNLFSKSQNAYSTSKADQQQPYARLSTTGAAELHTTESLHPSSRSTSRLDMT